jgi:hypothetical protein
MKIMRKITWHHNRIQDGDAALAERIRTESIKALFGGKGSNDWKKFMRNFHSNPRQLKRLLGDDAAFMANSWGPVILAYLVGSGPCGGGTNFAMIMDMRPNMKAFLDEGIDDPSTAPGINSEDDPVKIPESLKRYLEGESLDTDEGITESTTRRYESQQVPEGDSSETADKSSKSVIEEAKQSLEDETS